MEFKVLGQVITNGLCISRPHGSAEALLIESETTLILISTPTTRMQHKH